MILYSIQAFLTFSIVDGFMSDKYEKIYKDWKTQDQEGLAKYEQQELK